MHTHLCTIYGRTWDYMETNADPFISWVECGEPREVECDDCLKDGERDLSCSSEDCA
jgi:hypothetical protein